MKSISIFTSSYSVGSYMGGIGVRIWEISQVLSKYFKVSIITQQKSNFKWPNITFKIFDEKNWKSQVKESDVIFCVDIPDTRILLYAHELKKLIVTENAIPIEHLEYDSIKNSINKDKHYYDLIMRFKLQILVTDHFITRSKVEEQTLITAMAMMGRINYINYLENENLRNLISYVPIGFNKLSDVHQENSPFIDETIEYVWNGGIWDYLDANMALTAIEMCRSQKVDLKMKFMYHPPTNQNIQEYKLILRNINEKKLNSNVKFINENLQHYERDKYLKSSRAIVCLGKDTIENYTCVRLRVRDVFLYKKPIVIDNFGATASFVKTHQIGLVVSNEKELAEALVSLKRDDCLYKQLVNNIEAIRNDYCIENNILGLVDFLNRGEKAKDICNSLEKHDLLLTNLIDSYSSLKEPPIYPI
ncbi:hypothetical protein [Clostridium cibarium]|uniref:Uncharacterized protein n=1 Tax=Clostridium cibarium TaxID=2762247 RepID=A0ABR8PY25_9CLOT|nr:hypothetical protein [Clostridium cibarium]MBD7913053.1 hypothetical protein [Clostridium cibarium]